MGNATYFNATDLSSVDNTISSLQQQETSAISSTVDYTTLATFYGMKNVSYAGGPSIGGQATNDAEGQVALAASRDPRMEQIVYQHYANYYANGGDTANYFSGPFGIWGPYNQWDIAEDSRYGDPTASPKYRGSVDVANAAPVAVTAGVHVDPTTATSFNAATDSLGQNLSRPNTGQQGYWLLNVATAGNYDLQVMTNANGGTAPGQVEVLLNDHVVGTVAVSASSTVDLGHLALSAGLNTLSLYVVHGAYDPGQSNVYYYQFQPTTFTLAPIAVAPPSVTQVNLSPWFNQQGIVADGATFGDGGLAGTGTDLSGNLLGTSQTWRGNAYAIGAVGGNNVVQALGQTIPLPRGHDATLQFLAMAVWGGQPDQPFTVTYTDGTSTTFTQGISDFYLPPIYPGESQSVTMAYHDIASGGRHQGPSYLYGISLTLDPSKTVQSITLPNNGNVKLIAIDLTPAPTLSATPFSGAGSVASASLTGANVSSANAFGASTSLGGGTGTGQIPAQWYQLPLAASQSFDRLVTDRGSATGTGSTGASNANFSPPFRRSVRVVQADSSGPGWGSIAKRTPFA